MRTFIAAFLFVALAQPSVAQPGKAKADPMTEPHAEMSTEAEVVMKLQEFTKKLEEAGFKDISLAQGLILQAKDKFDKPILMLVDPETGRQVRVDTRSRSLRERFAEAAAQEGNLWQKAIDGVGLLDAVGADPTSAQASVPTEADAAEDVST